MEFMLDTDISSYIIKGNNDKLMPRFVQEYESCSISAITAAELQYGATKNGNASLIKKVRDFCNLLEIVSWTAEAAVNYAKIRNDLEKAGTPIGNMDMLIAASALAENKVLVTNNNNHFSRIPSLVLENWC